MKNIKLSLQVGAVFIGTVVGAGFATGQEIMQFFTCFGRIGMLTVMLSGVLFYIIASAAVKAAARFNTYNYRDLMYRLAGRRVGHLYDILVTAFLFIGTSIMFAGSGALFRESLGISRTWGITVMALLTLIVILQALSGVLRINSVIVPMLFTMIVAVLGSTIIGSDISDINTKLAANYSGGLVKPLLFFIFYCCYNTFLSLGVLTAIPEKIKSPSVLRAGILLGAMGLMLLSVMLNISLTIKSPQVFGYSIPMSFITSGFVGLIKNAVTFCIWCEIFSTAVSNAFSISKRLCGSGIIAYWQACSITVLCCLPLAFLDFKSLISFFYPLFGVMSLYIIFRLICTANGFGIDTRKSANRQNVIHFR